MDVDLSELDDWLGTLEELQLGLEKTAISNTNNNNNSNINNENYDSTKTSNLPPPHVNNASPICLNKPPSPRLPTNLSSSPNSHTLHTQSSTYYWTGNPTGPTFSSSNQISNVSQGSAYPHSPSSSTSPLTTTSTTTTTTSTLINNGSNSINPTNPSYAAKPPGYNSVSSTRLLNRTTDIPVTENGSRGNVCVKKTISQKPSNHVSFNLHNPQEATAEHDLSSLLRELEVVEEKMKELEQENNQFTRRYSLASSSNGKRQNQTSSDQSHTENAQSSSAVNNNNNDINDQPVVSLPVPVRKGSLVNKSNGFICAEWAAKLNHDDYDNHYNNTNNNDSSSSSISRSRSRFAKQENTSPSPSPPPPPPAFLGAGDACASPTNTLPSPSHSSHPQILQQSQEQEQKSHQGHHHHHHHQLNETSWSISNSNNYSTGGMKSQASNSHDVVNSDYKLRQPQQQQQHHQVNQVHGTSPTPGYNSQSYQIVDNQKQLINELRGFYRNSSTRAPSELTVQSGMEKYKNFPNSSSSPSPPFNNYQQNSTTNNRLIPLTTDQFEMEKSIKINNNNNTDNNVNNNHTYASSKSSDGYRSCGSLTTYQGSTSHYDQGRMIMIGGSQQDYCDDNNDNNNNNNNIDAIVRGGGGVGGCGSGGNPGSWTPPDHAYLRRECHKTNSSLVVTTRGGSGSDGLSNSMSPESSLSDKSGSEANELSRLQMSDSSENNQRNKLVVRVFRPDKTTKAILIDHHMTAGEVASMMIEKNFLQPSIHLALVEKVPALKIERVFEEHDLLSDCILAWPTKSQNMIFFEERPDHFGLVESPDYWIGEDNNKQGFRTAEAIQTMLNDIDSHGFPEWRDYLFIRKPGDKSWSRRLCILRSSGLYTSNKNKKNLSSTDLIRILVLDGPLKLYTTTGGWTRMRAPTPHGFAFKPYSAQDPASTHVFCFCATDEKALRHWICRLRIAKYGRQLLTDYHMAISRVHQLISLQTQLSHHHHHPDRSNHPMLNMNLQSKSSCDYLSQSSSSIHTAQQQHPPPHPSRPPAAAASVAVLPTGSSTSLLVSSSSPSVFPSQDDHPYSDQYRYQRKPDQYYQYSASSRQSLSPNIQSSHPIRPVSPLMGIRARMSNNPVDHQSYNIINHNPASEQLGRQNRFPVNSTHHPMERYK